MNISWYGQSCFRLEGKESSILIDPFSKEIGLRAPRLADPIMLVTHEHYDHNNVKEAPAETFIIRGPGEYEKSGIYFEGINSYHDAVEGKERGFNTIYVIRTEDMRLCHLGDLGQTTLTDEQLQALGTVDILFIPIGGTYTINGKQAAALINDIEPKIIIPMHYKVPGLQIDLEGPESFLKEIGLKPEKVDNYRINKKTLPTEEIKLVMFNL